MPYELPFRFTTVVDDLVGRSRKKELGYRLIDSNGGIWEFVVEKGATRTFLAFINVPKHYKPMLGTHTAIPFFNEVQDAALKAIENYKLTKSLTPKTQQTFNDLINEL
jgi:hypothetical protein